MVAHSLAYGINSVLHAIYLSSDLVGFPNRRGLHRSLLDYLTTAYQNQNLQNSLFFKEYLITCILPT